MSTPGVQKLGGDSRGETLEQRQKRIDKSRLDRALLYEQPTHLLDEIPVVSEIVKPITAASKFYEKVIPEPIRLLAEDVLLDKLPGGRLIWNVAKMLF